MESNSLSTWESLAAMGGASLLTYFVVQYTKLLIDKWISRLPTDVYAVFVAWIVLSVAQIANGADVSDWRLYALALANAFLVAAAAGQIHNKAISPPGKAKGATVTPKEEASDGGSGT